MNDELLHRKAELLGSFLLFTRVFYKIRTGRDFVISQPNSRESHYITIAKALTKVLNGEITRLIINVPPRYGKTEMLISFVAWALARYPDSNFLYISYGSTLAKKQTQTIRDIVLLPEYRKLFHVELNPDQSAKDNFETNFGGSVVAAGEDGAITGKGAGIQNCSRFGGAIIIDDIHKPKEVTSDTMRQATNDWFKNTMQSRVNSSITPIIFIGQRLHEDDLPSNLINGFDGNEWHTVILPALDPAKNALLPSMHTKEHLLSMQEKMPYEFASQYQQDPQPAGGGIFKPEWFVLLDEEPTFLETFITCDTAETDKSYNDATVFSFWGLYKIKVREIETDMLALHWIDCYEIRIEPKDLESEFGQFYFECMQHKIKPRIIIFEKKSTGITLGSVVNQYQGMQVINVERTKASGNKAIRYLQMQPYVASKRISLPRYGKHTNPCLEHMRKITANDTHRHDDIADTAYDAVKLGLIDEAVYIESSEATDAVLASLAQRHAERKSLRSKALCPTR